MGGTSVHDEEIRAEEMDEHMPGGPRPDGGGPDDPGSVPVTSCAGLPDTTPCTDNNACTQGDMCIGNQCKPGAAVTCSAQDQCHDAGVCSPATGANPL